MTIRLHSFQFHLLAFPWFPIRLLSFPIAFPLFPICLLSFPPSGLIAPLAGTTRRRSEFG